MPAHSLKTRQTKGGDCFVRAAGSIWGENRNNLLVHGKPWSDTFKRRIAHAWIEFTRIVVTVTGPSQSASYPLEMVYDPSQPVGRQEYQKSIYYRAGRLTEAYVKRYTPLEASEAMERTKSYGPWRDGKWSDQKAAFERNQREVIRGVSAFRQRRKERIQCSSKSSK